jgi:hypothetical protein
MNSLWTQAISFSLQDASPSEDSRAAMRTNRTDGAMIVPIIPRGLGRE